MPTKHLEEEQVLIGISADLLPLIGKYNNVSSLWEAAKENKNIGTFERFVLALDLLYLLGLLELGENREVKRVNL